MTRTVVDGLGLLEDFSAVFLRHYHHPSSSATMVGAANSTGGVMVKMIDAQFIVVSSSATHQQGNEAAIFKAVFWHSIVLASLVGLIVMFHAYVIPSAIP